MNNGEKFELGRMLERYRVMSVQYYAEQDIYTIWYLDSKDKECCETINGTDLE